MKECDIDLFEDFSNTLITIYSKAYKCNIKEFKDCTNNGIIIEGSFNRLLYHIQPKDFVILSAYIPFLTKTENIQRNRLYREILNQSTLGVYQLVGHAKVLNESAECEIKTAEKSYLVIRPENLEIEEFLHLIVKCLKTDKPIKVTAIFHSQDDILYIIDSAGVLSKIGQSLDEAAISHAYSKFIRNDASEFIYDGIEYPSSNSGRWLYNKNNILYWK